MASLTNNLSLHVLDVVVFFAMVHFFIVSASIVQPGATAPLLEFNEVFNPAGDPQAGKEDERLANISNDFISSRTSSHKVSSLLFLAAFMNMVTNYPNFVAEGKIFYLFFHTKDC
jgi:hypothetical protein